jgi:hypothetical protein
LGVFIPNLLKQPVGLAAACDPEETPLSFETLSVERQVERAVLPAGERVRFGGLIGA